MISSEKAVLLFILISMASAIGSHFAPITPFNEEIRMVLIINQWAHVGILFCVWSFIKTDKRER